VLGAGGCDNTVAIDRVTTDGFGSTGGIVSAVGSTDVNIGVLRTGGDEAAGLRLSADPTACAVLGAGGCDTAFSVGELTTSGDGATGILVRSSGDTSGDVGVLRTSGNDAAGIDIASDPTACVIAGAGACDGGLAADDVQTSGDGAGAVVIRNAGATAADLGRLATAGDDSAGLSITQDPAACLALGPGTCRVDAQADDVSTGGDNSPGIDVSSPGPVTVDAGQVTTDGPNSDAIRAVGGDEPVTVTAGAIVTTGPDSDGIDVTTDNGDQVITAGSIRVSGARSDGIVATSLCGDISITARDDIVSAQGSAILASTGCSATITTLPGASLTGATAGIDVTAGTGSTITIGDSVSASAGPAIDADGRPAAITIAPTGSVIGRVDLTDSADTLTNNGLLDLAGTSSFGAGADLVTNNGVVRAQGNAALTGLEQFNNAGAASLMSGPSSTRWWPAASGSTSTMRRAGAAAPGGGSASAAHWARISTPRCCTNSAATTRRCSTAAASTSLCSTRAEGPGSAGRSAWRAPPARAGASRRSGVRPAMSKATASGSVSASKPQPRGRLEGGSNAQPQRDLRCGWVSGRVESALPLHPAAPFAPRDRRRRRHAL